MVWDARPGETVPLQIDWTGFGASVPGYALSTIEAATLTDMLQSPPDGAPALDTEIKLVSGFATDPAPPSTPGFTAIIDGRATENLIWTAPDLPVGRTYRFDLTVGWTNCNGRKIVVHDCVSICIVSG